VFLANASRAGRGRDVVAVKGGDSLNNGMWRLATDCVDNQMAFINYVTCHVRCEESDKPASKCIFYCIERATGLLNKEYILIFGITSKLV
jgi:hypothetical protein